MTDQTKLLLPIEEDNKKFYREEDKEKIECEGPMRDNESIATRTRSEG